MLLALQILLLMVCMMTMALKVMSRNYQPALLPFIASTSILALLAYPRYGLSAAVVACCAGIVVAFLLIGPANYWVRSRVVGWSMPFWSRFITFKPPKNEDKCGCLPQHDNDNLSGARQLIFSLRPRPLQKITTIIALTPQRIARAVIAATAEGRPLPQSQGCWVCVHIVKRRTGCANPPSGQSEALAVLSSNLMGFSRFICVLSAQFTRLMSNPFMPKQLSCTQ